MDHRLFIHSPTEGYLFCFQIWAIINKAAYKSPCAGFLGNISLQLFGLNTKKHVCWVTYVYFYKEPPNCVLK